MTRLFGESCHYCLPVRGTIKRQSAGLMMVLGMLGTNLKFIYILRSAIAAILSFAIARSTATPAELQKNPKVVRTATVYLLRSEMKAQDCPSAGVRREFGRDVQASIDDRGGGAESIQESRRFFKVDFIFHGCEAIFAIQKANLYKLSALLRCRNDTQPSWLKPKGIHCAWKDPKTRVKSQSLSLYLVS